MSTVTGHIALTFADGTVLEQTHLWPADLNAADAIGTLLSVWDAVQPDLAPLVAMWGPLVDLSWTVDVMPTVIPLPGSSWLLGGALVALAWVRR